MSKAAFLPNLEIDVEIPWALKRDDKQVYARLVDFGSLSPSATVGHGIKDVEWIQLSWDHSYLAKYKYSIICS